MALLFNDWAALADSDELPAPDARRAAAFSPLEQVRRGNYHTPTYVVFGDADEIAPCAKAAEFTRALADSGVRSGFLPVPGAKHIFDLGLAPGSDGWAASVGPGYDFLMGQLERPSC